MTGPSEQMGSRLRAVRWWLVIMALLIAAMVLVGGATRLTDPAAVGLVVTTIVVLHGASGILDLVYMGVTDVSGTMIGNAVLRFAVVAVFLVLWRVGRRHHTPGINR